jgi:hypothetical protein
MVRHLSTATVLVLILVGAARSNYVFEFADGTGAVQTAFTANAGDLVDVEVLLAQTNGDTGLTDSGLFAAGVRVTSTYTSATPPATYPDMLSNSDIMPNPAFDGLVNNSLDGMNVFGVANFLDSGFVTEGILANPAPTGNSIYLGTFVFHTSGVPGGEVIDLQTSSVYVGSQDNILNDQSNGIPLGTPLDPDNATATITILGPSGGAVPEPSTLTLMGLGLMGTVVLHRYRNRPRGK